MMLSGSPNFSLSEVERASSSLTISQLAALAPNISRTLGKLEAVRGALGHRAVTINSLARSGERNEEVGGSETSDHINGLAADIRVAGLTPKQVVDILGPQVRALGLDQLIQGSTYVHVGAGHRGRGQVLIALGGGRYIPWSAGQAAPITITAQAPEQGVNRSENTDAPQSSAVRDLGPLAALLAVVVAIIAALTKGG